MGAEPCGNTTPFKGFAIRKRTAGCSNIERSASSYLGLPAAPDMLQRLIISRGPAHVERVDPLVRHCTHWLTGESFNGQ